VLFANCLFPWLRLFEGKVKLVAPCAAANNQIVNSVPNPVCFGEMSPSVKCK